MDKLFSTIKNALNQNNKSDLLQNQQATQQKINDLLNQSTEVLMCGPECQKKKISEELKQKYLDAETNMKMAPSKLEETKKNYYVYTEGRTYYDNMREDELKQTATKVAELLTTNFNEELTNANTMNAYLNTALINSNYTSDLLDEYTEKNKAIKKDLEDNHGSILTNDRKTYYETNAIDRLKLWYKFFWYIYYFLVIVMIMSFILASSNIGVTNKVSIALFLLVYPYIIYYFLGFIYSIWKKIQTYFPKNVYNNL